MPEIGTMTVFLISSSDSTPSSGKLVCNSNEVLMYLREPYPTIIGVAQF
jgi:hypothetical protein